MKALIPISFVDLATLPSASDYANAIVVQGGKPWFSDGTTWVDLSAMGASVGAANMIQTADGVGGFASAGIMAVNAFDNASVTAAADTFFLTVFESGSPPTVRSIGVRLDRNAPVFSNGFQQFDVWHEGTFDPTSGPPPVVVSTSPRAITNSDSNTHLRATAAGAKTFTIGAGVNKYAFQVWITNAAASGVLTIQAEDGEEINGVSDGAVIVPVGASAVVRDNGLGGFDVVVLGGDSPAASVRTITAGFDAGRVNGVDQLLTTGLRFELRAVTGLAPITWTLLPKAGSTGDITIEVRKRPFTSGTFTAITAGSPPSVSAGARGAASASAWTAIDAGDLIEFEVTAVSGLVTGANLIIEATQA